MMEISTWLGLVQDVQGCPRRCLGGEDERRVRASSLERGLLSWRVICFSIARLLHTGRGREENFLTRPLRNFS